MNRRTSRSRRIAAYWHFDRRRLDARPSATRCWHAAATRSAPARISALSAIARVGMDAAPSLQGRLCVQPPQRLPDDAAPAASPVSGLVRWTGHQRHHRRAHASTVPLQALYLLNNPFVLEQARGLAQRLSRNRAKARQAGSGLPSLFGPSAHRARTGSRHCITCDG